MNVIRVIRAILNYKGEKIELDLKSAIIKCGKAILRSADNRNTYKINAEKADIVINNGSELSEDDIEILSESERGTDTESQPTERVNITSEQSEPENKEFQTITEIQMSENIESYFQQADSGSIEVQHEVEVLHRNSPYQHYGQYKKRVFTVTLYEDEYNHVVSRIKSYGCRRNDFFLACINSAKKSSFDSEVKKSTQRHAELKKELKKNK